MSSINLVNNSILSPTRPDGQKVDDYILCNTGNTFQSFSVQTNTLPSRENILQKQSSFIQNSRLKGLKHHKSKLDLIDDTKLTSLPLPPPPKSRCSVVSQRSNTEEECTENQQPVLEEVSDEDVDEDIEESEYPIVLIEDYVTNNFEEDIQNQRTIHKKTSLAIFKDRIYNNEDVPGLSVLSAVSDEYENVSYEPYEGTFVLDESPGKGKEHKREQNLEEIFGKIPGSDSLKYCDLCEKPLYEISSIIDNSREPPTKPSNASLQGLPDKLYSEFVCWDCIETYEEFFNELCIKELDINQENILKVERNQMKKELFGIFQQINEKYCLDRTKDLSQIETNGSFSNDLIEKLYQLDNKSNKHLRLFNGIESFKWVAYLQYQLRWRWRIAGLLPDFLKSKSPKPDI